MTRQHFQAVARFISIIEDDDVRRRVCLEAIRELRQFNSNFDTYRFKAACNVDV